MHNNADFFSRLSSNAYEFDKREIRFHLRKSVVTFAKKIINVNGTYSLHKNFGSCKRLFQENEIV